MKLNGRMAIVVQPGLRALIFGWGSFHIREMTMAFKICVTGVIVVVFVALMGFMVIMGMVAWYRITVGEWNFATAYIVAMLAGFWCWVNLIVFGVWLWREG